MLLERDDELERLAAAIASAGAERGGIALVEGPAGAGKSSLLAEATRATPALRAAGGELERDFAFGVIRQLFEPVLGSDRRAAALAGAAAPAAALIQGTGAVEAGFGAFNALRWLALNVAAMQPPLVLVVDDLHWADDASLRALDFLARRAGDAPVAILASLRPTEPGAHVELLDALRATANVDTIVPAPLSTAAVAALVRAERPAADGPTCAALHVASAGNPLYLRELLRAGPALEPAAIEAVTLPGLGERVMRRIGRLAPEAPGLAGAMAVLGDGGRLVDACALADVEPAVAGEVARDLVRLEVLSADDPFAFAHPVMRHTLYGQLSTARRASMHRAAAARMEATGAPLDRVAGHLMPLPPDGSDAVAARLLDAARDALARAAPITAVRRLERALAEGAVAPARIDLLTELVRAEAAARLTSCIDHLHEAFALADDDRRAHLAGSFSEALAASGEWDAAWEMVTGVLAGVGEHHPEAPGLHAIRAVMMANDPRQTAAFGEEWLRWEAFAQGERWPNLAVAALLSAQAANHGHGTATTLAHARHALRPELLSENGGGNWATMQVAIGLAHVEALDDLGALGEQLRAAGRRSGALLATGTGMVCDAWAATRRGDLRAAEARVPELARMVHESGMALWLATVVEVCQDVFAERPGLDDLADDLLAFPVPAEFLATAGGAQISLARGRVALARGDRATALVALRACADVNQPVRTAPARAPWRSLLAEAIAPDDPEEALALAEEELALAADYARARGVALRACGILRGDPEALEASLAALEPTPAALERAYTRYWLGVLLHRRRHADDAREHLTAAREAAEDCGAQRLFARATDALRATGARPRRVARSGADSLTPQERRVADLAAAGRSNAEIAQELFVSFKTVETQLTSAYGKLGLSGRGARPRLAEALERS